MNIKKLSVQELRKVRDLIQYSPEFMKEKERYNSFLKTLNNLHCYEEISSYIDSVPYFDKNFIAKYMIENNPCNFYGKGYEWHVQFNDYKDEEKIMRLVCIIDKEANFIKYKHGTISSIDKQRLYDIWHGKIQCNNYSGLFKYCEFYHIRNHEQFVNFKDSQLKEWIRFANFVSTLNLNCLSKFDLNLLLLKTVKFKKEDIFSYWENVAKDFPNNPKFVIPYKNFLHIITINKSKNNKSKHKTKQNNKSI